MQTKLNDGSILIGGFLSNDAEYKQVGNKQSSLTKFSVNVGKKPGADKPTWVNCQCWHETARAAASLKKFDVVMCFGHIEQSTYTAQNGEQKTDVHLVVEGIFVQPRPQQITQEMAYTADPMIQQAQAMIGSADTPF